MKSDHEGGAERPGICHMNLGLWTGVQQSDRFMTFAIFDTLLFFFFFFFFYQKTNDARPAPGSNLRKVCVCATYFRMFVVAAVDVTVCCCCCCCFIFLSWLFCGAK